MRTRLNLNAGDKATRQSSAREERGIARRGCGSCVMTVQCSWDSRIESKEAHRCICQAGVQKSIYM